MTASQNKTWIIIFAGVMVLESTVHKLIPLASIAVANNDAGAVNVRNDALAGIPVLTVYYFVTACFCRPDPEFAGKVFEVGGFQVRDRWFAHGLACLWWRTVSPLITVWKVSSVRAVNSASSNASRLTRRPSIYQRVPRGVVVLVRLMSRFRKG